MPQDTSAPFEVKTCRTCGECKPRSGFYRNGPRYRPDCKACVCEGLRNQYQEDPELRAAKVARNAEYYRTNREAAKEYAREARRRADPQRERERGRRRSRQ